MGVRSEVALNLAGICQSLVTSVAQLRVHLAMVRNWGYPKLEGSLTEVFSSRSALLDDILSSILAAQGTPDLQGLNRLNIGQTVEEILQSERNAAHDLQDMVVETMIAWPAHDIVLLKSLERLAHALASQCLDFERSLELNRQMGTQNFLATRC
jgi:bacterioferritin